MLDEDTECTSIAPTAVVTVRCTSAPQGATRRWLPLGFPSMGRRLPRTDIADCVETSAVAKPLAALGSPPPYGERSAEH